MYIYSQILLCAIILSTTYASQTAPRKRQASDKEAESSDYQAAPPSFYRFVPKNAQPLRYQQAVSYVPQEGLKYAQVPPQLTFGYVPQQVELAAQGQNPAQAASGSKYASSGKDAAPAPVITYSPASEVSSFRFNSPLVSYSNLGVLHQVIGKTDETEVEVPTTQSTPAPSAQKYAPPRPASNAAAQQPLFPTAYKQTQKPSNPKYAYALVPQKVAYAPASQELAYTNDIQQPTYSSGPQKFIFALQPQPQVQKAAYIASASRHLFGLPHYIPYSGPQESTQQFALAFDPQSVLSSASQNLQHSAAQRGPASPQYQINEQNSLKSEKEDNFGDAYTQ